MSQTNRQTLIEFFKHFPSLSDKSISLTVEQFEYKEIEKGKLFLKEGQIANEYLFLQSGFIRSYVFDANGKEITINFYAPNQVVFEVSSFFQRIPSEEFFEAISNSVGWVLTYEKLNYLFHTLPEFREFGRAMLVRGYAGFKKRTLSLITKTAEERYEMLLNAKPEVFQHASLKHIASYLGITDTSLSRIRKNILK